MGIVYLPGTDPVVTCPSRDLTLLSSSRSPFRSGKRYGVQHARSKREVTSLVLIQYTILHRVKF
jgi:hypothetical protein